jgi:hypothetical protein
MKPKVLWGSPRMERIFLSGKEEQFKKKGAPGEIRDFLIERPTLDGNMI